MKDFVHLRKRGVDHSLPPSLFVVSHCVSCDETAEFLFILWVDALDPDLKNGVTDEGLRVLCESGCGEKLTSVHLEGA